MSGQAEYLVAETPGAEVPAVTPLGVVVAEAIEPPLSEELPEETRRHAVATVLSVGVNLLILMLLIWWAVTPNPAKINAIPITIVSQVPQSSAPKPPQQAQPPAPKPPPPKQQAQQKPPPPKPKPKSEEKRQLGPLASDDLGNPDAPKDSKLMTQSDGGGPDQLVDGSELTHDTGTTAVSPTPSTPSVDAMGDKSEKPKTVEQPLKKKGGSKVSLRPDQSPHAPGKYAKLAGPPATRDEYLAYIKTIIVGHFESSILAANAGRHGHVILNITILPSGHINFVVVAHGSGWRDIDSRFVQMVYRVGDLPPVPARFNDDDPNLPIIVTFFAPF